MKKDCSKAMYEATRLIIEKLDEREMNYRFEHYECSKEGDVEHDWIDLKLKTDNIASIEVELFINEDNYVSVRSFWICKVTEEKKNLVLETLNELNKEFHWVKFFEDDNYVCAAADATVVASDPDFASRMIDFIANYMDVLNEAYPKLMIAIWGRTKWINIE